MAIIEYALPTLLGSVALGKSSGFSLEVSSGNVSCEHLNDRYKLIIKAVITADQLFFLKTFLT